MRVSNKWVTIEEFAMAFLSVLSGALLTVELSDNLSASTIGLIDRIDISIALVFLVEFLARLYFAERRKEFFRKNWWELLAAIPVTTPVTEALRLLRLIRFIRIGRIMLHFEFAKEETRSTKG